MRVFVTGATGFIGSAVVQELISSGHQVIGLTRTEQGAQKLAEMGAQAMPGSLEDLESLRKGAREADGVVHLAFVHALSHVSFSRQAEIFIGGISKGITQSFVSTVADVDGKAIEAIGSVLQGTQRPFVTANGTLSLKPGQLRTEHDDVDLNGIGGPRGNSEKMMLALASKGIRSSVIRLPPSVHGDGDKGFMSIIIKAAQKNKASAYIGDGLNRWPAVHRLDAAHLIRLALEKGAPGARYHGVGDEGIPWTQIAELIGRRLSVPVVSKSGKAASKHFGFLSLYEPLAARKPARSRLSILVSKAAYLWPVTPYIHLISASVHPDLMVLRQLPSENRITPLEQTQQQNVPTHHPTPYKLKLFTRIIPPASTTIPASPVPYVVS